MTTSTALRVCSTDGCERAAAPHWAQCAGCLEDILDPSNARRTFIGRLRDDVTLLLAPAARPGHRDLAVGLRAGASRDGGVRTEMSAHRVHGAQVSLSGGAGRKAPVGAVADNTVR